MQNEETFIEEVHPWLWYAPVGCTTLAIGTFPTAQKNRAFDFYYPNLRNAFWKIMSQLSGLPLTFNAGQKAVEVRKEILNKMKFALTDMGYKIVRKNGSSLDTKLSVLEYMDIFRILDENPGIVKIILTSSSGKSSAFSWFKNYLNERKHPVIFNVTNLPFSGALNYKGRDIVIRVVPSTSPAAAISFEALLKIYEKEF